MSVCSFKPYLSGIECDPTSIGITEIQWQERVTLLSSIGMIFGTLSDSFSMCNVHRNQLKNDYKARLVVSYCSVPERLTDHQGTRRKKDRTVTDNLMEKNTLSNGNNSSNRNR